jgi:hypothetical protein
MDNIADKFLQIIAFIDANTTPQQWKEMESDLDDIYHLLHEKQRPPRKTQILNFTDSPTCQYEDYDFDGSNKRRK